MAGGELAAGSQCTPPAGSSVGTAAHLAALEYTRADSSRSSALVPLEAAVTDELLDSDRAPIAPLIRLPTIVR